MVFKLSIKGRLYLLGMIAFALIMGVGTMHWLGLQTAEESLKRVYEWEVIPETQVAEIEQQLQRISIRIYGVVAGEMAALGSIDQIQLAHQKIVESWRLFKQMHGEPSDEQEQAEIRQIDSRIEELNPQVHRLAQAFRSNDKAALRTFLAAEWGDMELGLIAPLRRLIPMQREQARAAYEQSLTADRSIRSSSLGILVLGAMSFAWFVVSLTRYLNRNIGLIDATLARVAAGDLAAGVQGIHHGEIGRIASSLNRTLEILRSDRDAIETLQRQNQLILDSMAEGMYGVDAAGDVIYLNAAAESILGWRASELIGKPSHETMHHTRADGAIYPRTECTIYKAARLAQACHSEQELFWRKDGSSVPVEFTAVPLVEDGQLKGGLCVFRDITERKRHEDALRRTVEELTAANRELEQAQHQLLQSEKMAAIGQLAAGVAHEINNPVGFVYSNCGTLGEYVQDLFSMLDAYEKVSVPDRAGQDTNLAFLRQDIVDLLSDSKEGLKRIKNIVRDLKEFSHPDAGEWQWADLHKGLDATLNIVHNELKYKAKVVKEYGELSEIYCLPPQLNQVFMNILVNAGQAIEDQGVITVRTGQAGDQVWIEISDTGKGIAPEHLNRIFDPFFTTKPVGKGTGLGLSLSYGIIEKHAGRIEVKSELDRGTTFRIWLPVAAANASPAEVAVEAA